MQLVAYGAQDIYLTGNPQITFFKVVYRRHTNFSMETISQSMDGNATIGTSNNDASCTIARNGDLIHKVYVAVLSGNSTGINHGSSLVKEVELEIGGQLIDKHTEEWNNVWNELSTSESKAHGLKSMQCDDSVAGSKNGDIGMVQVPLNFYFCRNPGLALPLIALQYHEVKLNFVFGNNTETGGSAGSSIKVYVDYIYLDTDERRRFAQVSHEYLIEQLQIQSMTNDTSQELTFNHPVKEIIWTHSNGFDYGDAVLKLNGHERFEKQQKEYFQLRHPFDYHTSVPKPNLSVSVQAGIHNFKSVELSIPGFGCQLEDTSGNLQNNDPTKPLFRVFSRSSSGTISNTPPESLIYLFEDGFFGDNPDINPGDTLLITGIGTLFGRDSHLHSHIVEVFASGADDGNVVDEDGNTVLMTNGTGSHPSGGSTNCFVIIFKQRIERLISPVGDGSKNYSDPSRIGLNLGEDTILNGTIRIKNVFKLNTKGGVSSGEGYTSQISKKINVYSFSLKPEEHQPSGTCNFSRIDTAALEFSTAPTLNEIGNIYAVNYNVLRIMSGMGGLAYSN